MDDKALLEMCKRYERNPRSILENDMPHFIYALMVRFLTTQGGKDESAASHPKGVAGHAGVRSV